MLEDLHGFRGGHEMDEWRWRLEENGRYTVKFMYTKLEGLMLGEGPTSFEQRTVFLKI